MRRAAVVACSITAFAAPAVFAGVAGAQDSPFPDQSHFQKVTLNDRPGEPMSLAVLPDGRVLHSARTGEIRLHNPRTGTNNIVTDMKAAPQGLYQHDEEGVQGIAIDPDFQDNRWVYVYYSPRLNTPTDVIGTGINEGDAPETLTTPRTARGSRSSTGTACCRASSSQSSGLDFASEQEILRVNDVPRTLLPRRRQDRLRRRGQPVPVHGRRHEPVPVGGLRAARRPGGPQSGVRRPAHVRQHERPARQAPAHPRPGDGSYGIPAGNLFRPGQARTRPEIYAMGMRNPFRFAVNRTNGDVYLGDYSPDAQVADPARGPEGTGRWMLDPPGGQLRLAVLHHARPAVRRLRLHARRAAVRRGVQLLRADQRLAQQHRLAPAAAGRLAGGLVLLQHGPGPVPGAVRRTPTATASGRWAVRRCSSTRTSRRRSGGRGSSRASRSSTSGRGTTRRCSS